MRNWLTGAIALMLAACGTTTAPPPSGDVFEPTFADQYLIGIGDTLSVNVYRNPELSVSVPVRPDGKITVPVAGDIMVGGLTPEKVSEVVAERLSEYIRDPIVTTTVTGMGSAEYLTRVRVTGAVNGPASMPFRNGMTVLDVVLEAGGLNEFANADGAVLYRRSGERLEIDLDGILQQGDMSTNYRLLPGDVITVPERIF